MVTIEVIKARARDCVFIISRLWKHEGDSDFTYGLLNSQEGIRVYKRGQLDPRLTLGGEPYEARDMGDAIAYMSGQDGEHLGKFRPVQVPLEEGYRVFKRGAFAPRPETHRRKRPYRNW